MNTKEVKLSLEDAKLLYQSDNLKFKELALKAFTKKELEFKEFSYYDIIRELDNKVNNYAESEVPHKERKVTRTSIRINGLKYFNYTKDIATYLEVWNKLKNIATFFNDGWIKEEGRVGHFLYRRLNTSQNNANGIIVGRYSYSYKTHNSVSYPIIYFKHKEDVFRAIKMFSPRELEILFTQL